MTEQELNAADVGASFQQVDRKGMTQRMGRDRFGNFRDPAGLLALLLNRANCDVLAWKIAWEEPIFRFLHSPPGTQDLK